MWTSRRRSLESTVDRDRDLAVNRTAKPAATYAPRSLRCFVDAPLALDDIESWLAQVDQRDAQVLALCSEKDRAGRIRRELPATGPLMGVPFGVKDLFSVDGLVTRAGSSLPPEELESPESSVVTRFKRAGAIVLGKTTTDEFAYAEPPATRNPWDPTRSPGGSSAGSAAAVAAGLCPFALGTQTSRSVIAPASFCGVVGVKPSHGRVPMDGIVPLSPSMDTAGFLAADVADADTIASVMIDDWSPAAPGEPRFGVPSKRFIDEMLDGEPAVAPFLAAVESLRSSGLELPVMEFQWERHTETVFRNGRSLLHGEMARVHARWWPRYRSHYRPKTAMGVEVGMKVSDDELEEMRAYCGLLRDEIHGDLDRARVDVFLLPAQPRPASVMGGPTGFGHTTTPWSLAGLPCVSVPLLETDGLPLGLQGVSRFHSDELLLKAMADLHTVVVRRER